MPLTAIVADSSICLPASLIETHGISIVPLSLVIGTETIADGALPAGELFRRVEASPERPRSASPAPGDFTAAFRAARDGGAEAAVCLTLSAEYSGTHEAALAGAELAREAMPGFEVRVADTGGLAMTHGFAVLAAAQAAEAGASPDDVVRFATSVGGRGQLIGMLDTLRYVVKGGRVPWIVGWAASVLRIKPVLAFEGGSARSIARCRTAVRARARMLDEVERGLRGGKLHIGVMHADAPAAAEDFAHEVQVRFAPAEVIVSEFTSVMAVHTGPGFLGVAFYEDE
jgi:DegV family protein with EDD domain